jgi:hypothetical protein
VGLARQYGLTDQQLTASAKQILAELGSIDLGAAFSSQNMSDVAFGKRSDRNWLGQSLDWGQDVAEDFSQWGDEVTSAEYWLGYPEDYQKPQPSYWDMWHEVVGR